MLTSMRAAFATGFWRWVLVVLLSVLIVSFAIWGIGDIFRGFGRERLATVGSFEISAERFRTEFDRERQNLSRRAGQSITNEQARALGLPEQILQRLLAEAALDERARELVLGVSDAELRRLIVDDEAFSPGGSGFNLAYFRQLLQANNLTEAQYVLQRRGLTLRLQIAQALTGGLQAPTLYDQIAHRFQNERRTAGYLVLTADRFAEVAPPDEATLDSYYGLVGAAFRSPERRTADVLLLVPDQVAQTIVVSDEDAQTIYDANRARYGTPERRRVQQIAFDTPEAADAALQRIREGQSFDDAATAAGRSAADIDLGTVTREQMIDPATRDAAFALAHDEVSGVVRGRFATVLLRVTAIEPGSLRPFEAVKDEIKRDLARERARRQIFDLHDKVEEERLTGLRLPEIAQKLGLALVTIENIDRGGRDPTGAEIASLPGGRAAVDAAFAAQPGRESDAVQLREIGGYLWVDVKQITPERDRPLAEVKDQVAGRWLDEQRRAVLTTKANEIVERLRGGADIDAVAAELGVSVKQTAAFTRRDTVVDFSRAAVDEAFRVAQGQPGSGGADNNVDRIVFVVTSSEVPAFDAENAQSVVEELSTAIQNDVLGQYVTRLQRDLGIWVNRTVLERIVNPTTGG